MTILENLPYIKGGHSGGSSRLLVPAPWLESCPGKQVEIGKRPASLEQTHSLKLRCVSVGPTAADLIWLMVLECGQLQNWEMDCNSMFGLPWEVVLN